MISMISGGSIFSVGETQNDQLADLKSLQKKGAKQEYAYQYIKNAIMCNNYKAGQKLNEVGLCEEMGGISRTPVRDALKKLSYEGLVEDVPGRGMFVTSIRFEDLLEVTEIRIPIETAAVEKFIERSAAEDREELKKIVAQHKAFFEAGEMDKAVDCDNQFHHIIGVGTYNSRLSSSIDSLIELSLRGAYMSYTDKNRIPTSIGEHEKILECILNDDREGAVEAMERHLSSWMDYVLSAQIKMSYFNKRK